MTEQDSLLKTISDYIHQNGGKDLLADLIISENHDIYQHEAVKADLRLREKGIRSYSDVKPLYHPKNKEYYRQAILHLYPHHTSLEISAILDRSSQYISGVIFKLIHSGFIKDIKPMHKKWSTEDDKFVLENGHRLNNSEISKRLGRTNYAVSRRKYILGVYMEERHKKPSGRHAIKY